jgi:hypothetical protein
VGRDLQVEVFAVSDHRGWVRWAAAAGERVGVVDSTGRLVNVGRLSGSNDQRKVVFSSESSSGTVDVWLDESGDACETLYRIVPMTPERLARWGVVRTCRDLAWNLLSDDVLDAVLAVVRARGGLKLPARGSGDVTRSRHYSAQVQAQGEGVYSWPSTTLRPRETSSVSLELRRPFVLERILVEPECELGRLSVVDLRSGSRSLFTGAGPHPASLFRGSSVWTPTFGRTVTAAGEELVLTVSNLSGDEVRFHASASGRSFNTLQEGTEYLADT